MSATSGIVAQGDYTTGSPANKDAVQRLIDLIPNPDAAHGSGSVQGGAGGFLDEMSPPAAAQLRVELTALKAAVENVA